MISFNEAVWLFLNKFGWVTVLTEAEVASLGSAEYFLTGSNIAKRRQAYQLTACTIFEILKRAFKNSADRRVNVNDIDVNDILLWCSKHNKECPQFHLYLLGKGKIMLASLECLS
jgi:hypothetical protein